VRLKYPLLHNIHKIELEFFAYRYLLAAYINMIILEFFQLTGIYNIRVVYPYKWQRQLFAYVFQSPVDQ
jgi:hypothetical protein